MATGNYTIGGNDPITYIMLRVEDSKAAAVDGVMETLEAAGVAATYHGAEEITVDREDDAGGPVIYFP